MATVNLDVSPPVHRLASEDQFDPSTLRRTVNILAARIDASRTTAMTRADALKGLLLNIPKVKPVQPDAGATEKRLILLRVSSADALPGSALEFLNANSEALVDHPVTFEYDYWTADEILQAVLPLELLDESPTSFTITGHIAHFNLREDYLPWKHLIGRVVLDKHKNLRTVVNKLDNIDTTFRFFKMEVLAGDPDFIVELSESNCRFRFDFSEVYWNSRLHGEHERLVREFDANDVVADVMAGVGPFAVPAAKKGCAVFGNDLNPNSAKYMQSNADDNKVTSRMRVSCQDGREFIRSVAHESWHNPFPTLPPGGLKTPRQLEKEARRARNATTTAPTAAPSAQSTTTISEAAPQSAEELPPRRKINHFVMNLPDSALTFLDAYRGCLSSISSEPSFSTVYDTMPIVHVHCFTRELEESAAKADIRRRAEEALGGGMGDDVTFHFVRSVAPNKDMWCVSFRLPREIALAEK